MQDCESPAVAELVHDTVECVPQRWQRKVGGPCPRVGQASLFDLSLGRDQLGLLPLREGEFPRAVGRDLFRGPGAGIANFVYGHGHSRWLRRHRSDGPIRSGSSRQILDGVVEHPATEENVVDRLDQGGAPCSRMASIRPAREPF